MAKWKLNRQCFGKEEFTFWEGDTVTIGRGINNTITLASSVISRHHCVINVRGNKLVITDLKSSNGVYVGMKKIPQCIPYVIEESNLIGIGWKLDSPPCKKINDDEKYVFKLTREKINKEISIADILEFESDNDFDAIEACIANLNEDEKLDNFPSRKTKSPVFDTQIKSKRKLEAVSKNDNITKEIHKVINDVENDIINILSDSDVDISDEQTVIKKAKMESKFEIEKEIKTKEEPPKTSDDSFQYDAFVDKQEYLGYDEPIHIDSDNGDSDSENESQKWRAKLSQSSPGKCTKVSSENKIEIKREDCSYSQLDDVDILEVLNMDNDEEECCEDIISIPLFPPLTEDSSTKFSSEGSTNDKLSTESVPVNNELQSKKVSTDMITSKETSFPIQFLNREEESVKLLNLESTLKTKDDADSIDGVNFIVVSRELHKNSEPVLSLETQSEVVKKAKMIEPLVTAPRGKSNQAISEIKSKTHSLKQGKVQKQATLKVVITDSQKKERKKKLKEIATKDKDDTKQMLNKLPSNNSCKKKINAKVTTSNRGAFLSDIAQAVVKPIKRKESPPRLMISKDQQSQLPMHENKIPDQTNTKANNVMENKIDQSVKTVDEEEKCLNKDTINNNRNKLKQGQESRMPYRNLKPLLEKQNIFSGKPFSKIEPFQSKKKVRFSEAQPQVYVFEIEPGNKMKSTSSVKSTLVDKRHRPIYSLEKISLMKILRWNPHWLDEQVNNNEPPPILGHNNPPTAILHYFKSHNQYVQLVGDLLLMEIWECLTQAYIKVQNQNNLLQMRIESLPPIPSPENYFDLFNFSVNISVPKRETRNVPKVGEVLYVVFGPETARNSRFFFVHNVRCFPSPPNNAHASYNVSLYATFTSKMQSWKLGEMMLGRTLAFIKNELMLFEALEYLRGSPLIEVILNAEPRHFNSDCKFIDSMKSQWTMNLNESQQAAVRASVSAALGDRPTIQMVQGPPGTGKSSVICAIVMTYLHKTIDRQQQNRGKILICATSNAAVDELVIRLLKIRQSLPRSERFRMVRVGRAEAMHPRAREVSSQMLAQRQQHENNAHYTNNAITEEIYHLEAKINMLKMNAQNGKDAAHIEYCHNRIAKFNERIALLQRSGGNSGSGGSGALCPPLAAERRVVEGADVIVTTLASSANVKLKGLKRRIALCIVDEAGQAIEPETLIPLMLDVTKLTLIGDPQQLPGFICSQRAKKHGLGESLFSRLTSCTEHWDTGSPVVLLNEQYRMHSSIADYPNRAFYNSKIKTASLFRPNMAIPPYLIFSISSGDKGQGPSRANEMEAWGVSRLVMALNSLTRELKLQLAVITPYNAHKDLIKKNLRMLQNPDEEEVEVNTVDSFQGQERDVVVVSLARSQGVGFLDDAGRMNVMLTRAKHSLIICLNPHAMMSNPQWRTLIEDAQKRNVFRTFPNRFCKPSSVSHLTNDEILTYIINKK